ncbi:hypothetical protein GQ53DRAFT_815157 [Thozetella sp. PMI_491]|nr:hypothetical protein GQ53DRAFT_815157 [Thozetella sp. PMI_491]
MALSVANAIPAITVSSSRLELSGDDRRVAMHHLDSQGAIDWQPVDGGSVAIITTSQIHEALAQANAVASNLRREEGQNQRRGWWTLPNPVDGSQAEAKCFNAGTNVYNTLITAAIDSACSTLIAAIPGGNLIENTYIYMKYTKGITDISGAVSALAFGFKPMNNASPPTKTLCSDAFVALVGACEKAASNQGGYLAFGSGSNELYEFDLDPGTSTGGQ